MPKITTRMAVVAFAGMVAACNTASNEFVVVDPEPKLAEPLSGGKVK